MFKYVLVELTLYLILCALTSCSDVALDSVVFELPATATGGQGSVGQLQVLHDSQWGYVCGDHWTVTEGRVACRQIGFEGTTEQKQFSMHCGLTSGYHGSLVYQ